MKKPKRMFKNRPPLSVERKMDANDMRFIAIHEAAHAVSAVHFGLGLQSVDIKRRQLPDGVLSVGYTRCPVPVVHGESEAMPWMIHILVASLAESAFNPHREALNSGSRDDQESARRIAVVALCPSTIRGDGKVEITPDVIAEHEGGIQAFWSAAVQASAEFADRFMPAICAVADALLAHRELSHDQVAAIVREHQPSLAAV
jgi:hypothetical protein